MFHGVLLIVWTAMYILLGANVYLEFQKFNDSLDLHRKSLLQRFPFHTTLCCDSGCKSKNKASYITLQLLNHTSNAKQMQFLMDIQQRSMFHKMMSFFLTTNSVTLEFCQK